MRATSLRVAAAVAVGAWTAAAAPARALEEIDSYYYLGVEAGLARGPKESQGSVTVTNGAVYGPLRMGSLTAGWLMWDVTGFKIASGEDSYGQKVNEGIEMMTFDLGVGMPIGPLWVGVIPYAWVWAADSSDGLGVAAKLKLDAWLLEGKVVPIAYAKDYPWGARGNNPSVSITWFGGKDGGLALGARYNQLGDVKLLSFMIAYGVGER